MVDRLMDEHLRLTATEQEALTTAVSDITGLIIRSDPGVFTSSIGSFSTTAVGIIE